MTESYRFPLKISRGLCAAVLCGLAGAFAPMGLALVLRLCRWLVSGSAETASAWVSDLEYYMEYPVVGCAAVSACAGCAAFAPVGTYRFVLSLAYIFFVSLLSWYVIGWLGLMPFRRGM